MGDVDISFAFDFNEVKKDLDKQLDSIFKKVLSTDIPKVLAKHDLEDPDSYTLLLRNRGRTVRRKLSTIRSEYLRLGKDQPEFRFVVGQGDSKLIKKYAVQMFQAAVRRAPARTGKYVGGMSYYVGSRNALIQMSSYGLSRYPLEAGESIYITSDVAYATALEAGFFKGYYQTQDLPGGILYFIARQFSKTLGNQIAISFEYINFNGGTFPAIRIGTLGSFSPRLTRPGSSTRRRRK